MKKSTLLSFATAAAIVVTSAGTYAAWDQTSASKAQTVTIRKGVTTSMEDLGTFSSTADDDVIADGTMPIYESTTTVNVADVPTAVKGQYELKIDAELYTDSTKTTKVENTVATIKGEETAESKTQTASNVNGEHTVNVTVTAVDETKATAAQNYYAEVTATLTKKQGA